MAGRGWAHIVWRDTTTGVYSVLHLFCTTRQHSADVAITEHAVEEGFDVTDNARPNPGNPVIEAFISNTPIISSLDIDAIMPDTYGGAIDVAAHTATTVPGNMGIHPQSPFFSPSNPGPLTIKEWFSAGATIGLLLGNLASFEVDDVAFPNTGLTAQQIPDVSATTLQFDQVFDAVKQTLDTLETLRSTSQIVILVTGEATYENVLLQAYTLEKNADSGTGATVQIQFKTIRVVSTLTVDAPKPVDARGNGIINQGNQGAQEPDTDPTSKSVIKSLLDTYAPNLLKGL